MDFIKETDLPGIGKKFSIAAKDGTQIIIIVHDDGTREIYHYDLEDEDGDVDHIITLDDNEARRVAGILGGMTYTPRALESMKVNLRELTIDWHKMEDCPVCDKSIGELGLRENIGVCVIAIIKAHGGENIINPGPNDFICQKDTVVLAGTREQIRNFHQLIKSEGK
ncbi:MAG: potassium:proton antiporter [Peptococcaceae bacterium]|jgi:TrkA domain protein|nr:potassium:proton antiporter [Peptococcaceae bacterium]